MRPDRSPPAILLLVFCLGSCAGSVADNSIATVPWATGESWSLERIWSTAASPDGPYNLRGPVVLSVGPDGQIYVADSQAPDIKVFTRDGEYLRTIATGGPAGLVSAGWSPTGAFWVVAPGRVNAGGGYKLFDSEGMLRAQHSRLIARTTRRTQPAIFDNDGLFIDVGAGFHPDGLIRINFELINSLGTKVGELEPLLEPPPLQPAQRGIAGMQYGFDPDAFWPHLVYRPLPDGSIWFAESSSLTLYLRGPSGDTVRVIRTSHRDDAFAPEQQRNIDAWLSATGEAGFVPGPEIVQAIFVLEDGHLLVQTPAMGDRQKTSFEVFDGSGGYLGAIPLGFTPDPESVISLQGDTIFAAARDEFDVLYLTRATLVREQ